MLWLIYCAFFVLMLIQILRMLRQRGKWAWLLFLGLIGSACAYVGLFVVPVAKATEGHRVLLGLLLVGGTLLYAVAMVYFVRKMALKLKPDDAPPP